MVTGTLVIQAGDAFTNTADVSLFITASSTGGTVTQMRLGNDGASLGAPQAFASNLTWTLAATDGIRAVTVQLIDSTGATFSTFDTIILDRVAPFGNFIVQSGAKYINTTTVPLVLTYTDANGMTGATARIQIDSGAFGAPVPYAAMLNATLPAVDGLHTITVQVTDAAGNIAQPTSQTITLDRQPPTLTYAELLGDQYQETNNRTPPMTAEAYDAVQLGGHCVQASFGGVTPPIPAPNDPCWRISAGKSALLALTPSLNSDERTYQINVWLRDAAGNVTSGVSLIDYDATPPDGGALVITQGDAGFRNATALVTFGTRPAGILEVEYGINPSNGGTPDPNLFIWSRATSVAAGNNGWVIADAPNDSLVSLAVRYADRARNGGQISNVITNLRPRATFQPIFTLPTAENLLDVARIPMPGGATRFIIGGQRDNTFTSDDYGVSWTKRDSLNVESWRGMAVSSAGQVLMVNSENQGGITNFAISADLGQYFRRVLRYTRGILIGSRYDRPSFISPRSTGGNHFALLGPNGLPAFITLDARNTVLELGSSAVDATFTDVAGCIGATWGGAIGINGARIFRSFDAARTYEELSLPTGFPATATLKDVDASGANVVILAQRSTGVVTLLRENTCGGGAFTEVTGLNFPANRVPVAVSAAGPNRAWVLSRSTTTEDVTISQVDFGTGTAQHLAWTPQARLNAIAGDTGNGVVVVGDRGEIYSTGSFPSFASRRNRPVESFTSLSVRRGTAPASAANGSAVVIGGPNGAVLFSNNSGAGWASAPVPAGTGPMRVDATHVAFNGIGALEVDSKLWLNPQTGWQLASLAQDASPYRGLSCYGGSCIFAGSYGAIARVQPNGAAIQSSFEVAPSFQSTVDWHGLDHLETPNGPTFYVVGSNGTQPLTMARLAGASSWSAPIAVTTGGPATAFTKVVFQRDGSGAAAAMTNTGGLFRSPSIGSPFVGFTGGGALVDFAHLGPGNRWALLLDSGMLGADSGPGALHVLPSTKRPVGVAISDADPNLIWVLFEDGAMFMSRTGLRQ